MSSIFKGTAATSFVVNILHFSWIPSVWKLASVAFLIVEKPMRLGKVWANMLTIAKTQARTVAPFRKLSVLLTSIGFML